MTPIVAGTWDDAAAVSDVLGRRGIDVVTVGSLGATVTVASHQAALARSILRRHGMGANVIEALAP